MSDILNAAATIEEYLIGLRRWFHCNPELSSAEENTVERIAQELDALGVRYVNVPEGGILAFLGDESRGPDTADRIYRGTLRDFYGQYFPAVAHLLD